MKIVISVIWLWAGMTALAACGDAETGQNTAATGDTVADSTDDQTGETGNTADTSDDDVLHDDNEIVVVKPRCKAQADCAVGDNCGGSDTCLVCDGGVCATLWEHVARTAANTLTLTVSAEWPADADHTAQQLCTVGASGESCAASGFRITAYYGPSCEDALNVVAASGDRLIAARGADFSEYPQAVAIDLPIGVELSLAFEMFPATVSDGATPTGESIATYCVPFAASAAGADGLIIVASDWRPAQKTAGKTK